jgi:hypothetical protein
MDHKHVAIFGRGVLGEEDMVIVFGVIDRLKQLSIFFFIVRLLWWFGMIFVDG